MRILSEINFLVDAYWHNTRYDRCTARLQDLLDAKRPAAAIKNELLKATHVWIDTADAEPRPRTGEQATANRPANRPRSKTDEYEDLE